MTIGAIHKVLYGQLNGAASFPPKIRMKSGMSPFGAPFRRFKTIQVNPERFIIRVGLYLNAAVAGIITYALLYCR